MREFLNRLFGREIALRNRIFRMVLMGSAFASVFGIIEELLLGGSGLIIIPMLILVVGVVISSVVTFRFNKMSLAAWILGFALVMGVFPTVFFFSGGINGGAPVWFVLGFVYIFLMFDGWQLYTLLVMALVASAGSYALGRRVPELIIPLGSEHAVYIDSSFSVVLIGVLLGLIIKFQIFVYEQERKVNDIQKEQLRNTGLAKNMFFAKISHEIRTPINSIIGLNEINLRQKLPGEARQNSVIIQQSAVQLLALVNEFLDLSQFEMGEIELIPNEYDTKKLFFNLMDIIQIRMRAKNLAFYMDIDPNLPVTLRGDEKRVNQIMINLLTNAVKFTEEGSVEMKAYLETISDTEIWLVVTVRDTGIGIRKEEIPYLFDYYHRIDEKNSHQYDGSGLGLSITKQLVELMDGEITVDSIYTKGSTFTIRIKQEVADPSPVGPVDFLERMRSRQQMMQRRYAPKFEAPEARLLVVDDSDMNIEVLRKLLAETKVQVDSAVSGDQALVMTKKHYYHIIFLDYMMPVMDGPDTLQAIRQQEGGLCQESPVICLTGTARTNSGSQEMSYGFDGYLQKPVRGELLERTILRYLPKDIVEYVREEDEQTEELMMSQLQVGKIKNRRKKRVCITTNCLCDLSRENIEKYGIRIIYSYIEMEKGRFVDSVEIDGKNMKKYLTPTEAKAKAVSPSVEDYENFFADTLEGAEDVIHISVAQNTGDSYANALVAAGSFDHVHVINSGQLSGGLGLLVLHAARLARTGTDMATIIEEVEKTKDSIYTTFLFPSAGVYAQNGHMGKIKSQIVSRMRFHPIFGIKDSGIHMLGVFSANWAVTKRHYIWWIFLSRHRIDSERIYVTHAGCSIKEMDVLLRDIRRRVNFDKVYVEQTCVANAVNAGLGAIGISFYRK